MEDDYFLPKKGGGESLIFQTFQTSQANEGDGKPKIEIEYSGRTNRRQKIPEAHSECCRREARTASL